MKRPHKGKAGLKRVWNALFFSLDGFAAAFKHEDAFRLEILLALILIPLALQMPVTGIGRALMVASVLLVLVVELLNSAIEAASVGSVWTGPSAAISSVTTSNAGRCCSIRVRASARTASKVSRASASDVGVDVSPSSKVLMASS